MPKIHAALYQSFEELTRVNKPENGVAVSALESELFKEARLIVAKMRELFETGSTDCQMKGQSALEEDFYLGNADSLIFALKDFKADLEPDNLYKRANPLLVAKLDIKSVNNFNFPRITQHDVVKDMTAEDIQTSSIKIVARMIDMAKKSVSRPRVVLEDEFSDSDDEQDIKEKVKAPSMMRMCCNMLEVLRLREQLIARLHETAILQKVYKN